MKNKQTKNAFVAGLLYLVLIIVGMYGFVYALPQIKIEGDIITTMSNIAKSESLFRLGIFSILLMNVVSIILALYLYKLLSPIHKGMTMFMLSFLLVGAGISMLNEMNHFAVLIINRTNTIEQAQSLTSLFIDMQKYGSHIAVKFWGLWLFPLGMLVFKLTTRISKIIGIMLIIAGIGYVLDSFILFLKPNLWTQTLSDFTFIGELLFTLWLLFKSKDIEQLVININKKENN